MKKQLFFLAIAATVSIAAIAAKSSGKGDKNPAADQALPAAVAQKILTGNLEIWSHSEPSQPLDSQYVSLKKVLQENPDISGVTLKFRWDYFHPAEKVINMAVLEKEVALCAAKGKKVELMICPGLWTPQWVMDKGVDDIGPFVKDSKGLNGKAINIAKAPKVWDPIYKRLLMADLKLIAKKFNNNPTVTTVTIMGHNYQNAEMHAPDVTPLMISKGYSDDMVVKEMGEWMDFYATTFPTKKLLLCVSQSYSHSTTLPAKIVDLFISKYRSRAILDNHQLNGRKDASMGDSYLLPIFQKYLDVPVQYEMVGSFLEQPLRQGTPEMTIYNACLAGPINNLRLWRRDCDDPKYARDLIDVWNKYKGLTVAQFKAALIRDGKYIKDSDWKDGMPVK